MADEQSPIEFLEAQIKSLTDTRNNLAGLVQKIAGTQAELMEAGHDKFSDALAEPFSGVSKAAEKLGELAHLVEIERNRLRSEGE